MWIDGVNEVNGTLANNLNNVEGTGGFSMGDFDGGTGAPVTMFTNFAAKYWSSNKSLIL